MKAKRINFIINKNHFSVLAAGEPRHPIILFLHGIPANAELWRETIEKVSEKGYYCLAPDLPGYGQTVIRSKEAYSLPGAANLLFSWIQQEGFSDIWLVGHDIGGGIAQILVSRNQSMFSRLTLSNCITADSWPVESVSKMIKAAKLGLYFWLALFRKFSSKTIFQALSNSFKNRPLSEGNFNRIFYDGKFHKATMIRKFQQMLKTLDNQHTLQIMQELEKVTIPVHLIWGMGDKFQSWEKSGLTLFNALPHSKVTKIQPCGHYLQIDAADLYIEALVS